MIDFLKVKPWPMERLTPSNYVVSPKFDGWRIRVEYIRGHRLRVFTRKGEISEELKNLSILIPSKELDSIIYEAEMYIENEPASQVVTAWKNTPERLSFYLIAIRRINGISVESFAACSLEEYLECFQVELQNKQHTIWNAEGMTPERLLEEAKEQNLEGWVLKGRMYAEWYKLKVTETADVFVTDLKEGKGKYEGEVGALYVSVFKDGKQTEIAAVSGMSDEVRRAITEKDIGRVCEIKYDRLEINRLRFPQFLRWREDKKRKECTWEQFI